MFKGEIIVYFNTGTLSTSAIVSEDRVINGKFLLVDIYDQDENKYLIGIPGESFSTTRKLWVPAEAITWSSATKI